MATNVHSRNFRCSDFDESLLKKADLNTKVFVLRPLLFPSRGCRTRALSSECKSNLTTKAGFLFSKIQIDLTIAHELFACT